MIAERLAALRARFVERSLGDREVLLRAIEADAPDRALIGGVAHRLAGGGGTVGLPTISAAAAVLEDACDADDADMMRTAAIGLCDVITGAAAPLAKLCPDPIAPGIVERRSS